MGSGVAHLNSTNDIQVWLFYPFIRRFHINFLRRRRDDPVPAFVFADTVTSKEELSHQNDESCGQDSAHRRGVPGSRRRTHHQDRGISARKMPPMSVGIQMKSMRNVRPLKLHQLMALTMRIAVTSTLPGGIVRRVVCNLNPSLWGWQWLVLRLISDNDGLSVCGATECKPYQFFDHDGQKAAADVAGRQGIISSPDPRVKPDKQRQPYKQITSCTYENAGVAVNSNSCLYT